MLSTDTLNFTDNLPSKLDYIESRYKFLQQWEEKITKSSQESKLTKDILGTIEDFITEKYGCDVGLYFGGESDKFLHACYGGPDYEPNNRIYDASKQIIDFLKLWYPKTDYLNFLDADAADSYERETCYWELDLNRERPKCRHQDCLEYTEVKKGFYHKYCQKHRFTDMIRTMDRLNSNKEEQYEDYDGNIYVNLEGNFEELLVVDAENKTRLEKLLENCDYYKFPYKQVQEYLKNSGSVYLVQSMYDDLVVENIIK